MPFLDLDGARLHVVTRGPSFDPEAAKRDRTTATALLLLHGLASSAADWTHQIEHFADRFDVVAPDFGNHGESSKGHGGSPLVDHAHDAAAVLDALGIERAHVVGVSMGGCVALEFGLAFPERTASVTITNASDDMRPRDWRVRLMMMLRRPAFRLLGHERIGIAQAQRLFPDPADAEARAISLASWQRMAPADLLAQFDDVLRWHIDGERLGTLARPLLALGSTEDFAPMAWKRALAEAVPDGRFEEIEGHHMAPLERPGSFNAALERFIG